MLRDGGYRSNPATAPASTWDRYRQQAREREGGEDNITPKGGTVGYDGLIDVIDGDGDGDGDKSDHDDDLPPGFDVDLPTAAARFALAYVKGLGGLVMGVVDVRFSRFL